MGIEKKKEEKKTREREDKACFVFCFIFFPLSLKNNLCCVLLARQAAFAALGHEGHTFASAAQKSS